MLTNFILAPINQINYNLLEPDDQKIHPFTAQIITKHYKGTILIHGHFQIDISHQNLVLNYYYKALSKKSINLININNYINQSVCQ